MASQVRAKPPEQWYREPGQPAPRPAKPTPLAVPRSMARAVLDRDEHLCQRCGRSVRSVLHFSLQHRRPRGAGGSRHANFLANLITVCGSATSPGGCHLAIEETDRPAATAQGFLVPQGHDPAMCAVLRWAATDHPVWSLLTDEGWSPAPAPAVVDTWSAASLEHFAATGRHLTAAQVAALAVA